MRLIDADAIPWTDLNDNPNSKIRVLITFADKVNKMPTIEERKGKWIPDNTNPYETRFICSNCNESQVVPTIGFTSYKPLWDWCPLCGCKMEV